MPTRAPHGEIMQELHEQLAHQELLPGQHLVDMGYVDTDVLANSSLHYQVTIVGSVLPDGSWQAQGVIIRKNERQNTSNFDLILAKISLASVIFSLLPNRLRQMFALQGTRERRVVNVYRLGVSISVLLLVVIGVAIGFRRVRSIQRRRALEQILERYYSGLALIRYIMLNRQCSEEAAYRRLATFVKKHVEDQSSIDNLLAYDKRGLLERARNILIQDPNKIDEI